MPELLEGRDQFRDGGYPVKMYVATETRSIIFTFCIKMSDPAQTGLAL